MKKKKVKPLRIAKIFGIDIEIHWSWFLALAYFSWILADKFFPQMVPKQSNTAYWLSGVFTVLMLFVSVIFHELAHSKVAQLFKIKIKKITLLIIGGIAQMESLGKKAKEEFLISIAGPLSSFLLAGIFWIGFKFINTNILLIKAILFQLFFINGILAVFNLLPAYPMDGGRIFVKTPLWVILKNQLKATKIAGIVGQIFGVLMIVFGVLYGAFWFVFLGWLLLIFAPQEYRLLLRQQFVRQLKAKDVMKDVPKIWMPEDLSKEAVCGPDDSLLSVLEKMANKNCSIVFVVENNKIIGMIIGEIKIKAPQRGAFLLFFGLK